MSGFRDAAAAIEGRLSSNWLTTAIKYEGAPFTEPTAAYVAIFIRDGEGIQISLGSPAVRRWPGIIMLQVFAPEMTGTRKAREYADSLGAIFDRVDFSSGNSGLITCRTPSIEVIGARDGWCQVNVTVPFRRSRQY